MLRIYLYFLALFGVFLAGAQEGMYQNIQYASVVALPGPLPWEGSFSVKASGEYRLYVDANAPGRNEVALTIDGASVKTLELPIAGRDRTTFRRLKLAAQVALSAGTHTVTLKPGALANDLKVRALLVEKIVTPHPWQLVWAEEFNGSGMPDQAKWRTEPGLLRGHEIQYYTQWRPENMQVGDGLLTITAIRERWTNAFFNPQETEDWRYMRPEAEFTSANLDTLGFSGWQYGRIDIRAQVTAGVGPWPAVWTMGEEATGWPDCSEIDIMEFFARSNNRITNACHYRDPATGTHKQDSRWDVKTSDGSTIEGNFHVYSMIWDENRIEWLLDGVKTHEHLREAGAPWPFDRPQYLIVNLAMGGDGGGPIDEKIQETKFFVDYIRVYQ